MQKAVRKMLPMQTFDDYVAMDVLVVKPATITS